MIPRPHIDWFALAPVNSLLAASALALLCAVLAPPPARKAVTATLCAVGYAAALGFAVALYVRSAQGHGVVVDAFRRDRLAELTAIIVAGSGLVATAISYRERWREDHIGEYYALLLFSIVPVSYRLLSGRRALTVIDVIITTGAISAVIGLVQFGILKSDHLGQRPQDPLGPACRAR